MSSVYENDLIRIEVETSEVPWLKIFTKEDKKEFSECMVKTRKEVHRVLHIIELEMLDYYQPEKINIASFGNVLPQVHWHIMARFENDSYFPEPMWGEKQRDGTLELPSIVSFLTRLIDKIS